MNDKPRENQGSELCQSCGLCCNGSVCNVALVSPQEDRDFANLFKKELVVSRDGKKRWVDLPCVAFKGNCSQYEIRPVDCRTYKCALLKSLLSGEISFEDASKSIELTLTSLDKSAAQYNAHHSRSLTRDQISPVMRKLQREAASEGRQKAFWLRYPEYMTFCFLKKRYFIE